MMLANFCLGNILFLCVALLVKDCGCASENDSEIVLIQIVTNFFFVYFYLTKILICLSTHLLKN